MERSKQAERGRSFESPLAVADEKLENDYSPVACVAQSGGEAAPKESVEMLASSFGLCPFSAAYTYRCFPGNRASPVRLGLLTSDGGQIDAMDRISCQY